jgi:hypothetical protein
MNLIQKVYEEMTTDDYDDDKQSTILKNEYIEATVDQQKAIDRFLLLYVGGALKPLLKDMRLQIRITRISNLMI